LLSVDSVYSWDTDNGSLITPGSLARMANVALYEFPAALPTHEQGEVVHASTHDDQDTEQH
jgi:hypothetical protein